VKLAWRIGIAALVAALAAPTLAQNRRDAVANAAREALPHTRGTLIVLDADSGKLWFVSNPAMAARRLAAPGSTVKPFVVHALLAQGKLRPDERIACPRKLAIAGHQLNCTHPELPGPLDPVQAIAYSCNTYVTTVAARFTPNELLDVFRKIGFASPTTLVTEEATGRLTRATNNDELRLQAIGEYGVHVTPLELAVAYRNLAQRLHGSMQTADVEAREGLEQAVAYGMAHAADVDEVKVAGKTGTSLMDNAAATHGWFAGYAPADAPRVIVVVYLEQGRGSDAAEIAAKVLRAYFGAKQ
jgi:cell division protein FtsI/penicillin-binding protein 2